MNNKDIFYTPFVLKDYKDLKPQDGQEMRAVAFWYDMTYFKSSGKWHITIWGDAYPHKQHNYVRNVILEKYEKVFVEKNDAVNYIKETSLEIFNTYLKDNIISISKPDIDFVTSLRKEEIRKAQESIDDLNRKLLMDFTKIEG